MKRLRTGALLVALFAASTAQAQVTQTVGSGSAVTNVDASASFNPTNSLNDNPYVENGLSFTRTGLSFNNNGCGYAGCAGHVGFVGFQGNYMYGVGNGYFDMFAPTGSLFYGLEFIVGTGFGQTFAAVNWTAYLLGISVSSGATVLNVGDVVGFSSATGFDQLRYTDDGRFGQNAPAFDEVRADLNRSVVTPEPASFVLMATGLALVGGIGARRRRSTKA